MPGTPDEPKFGLSTEFQQLLATFYGMWAATDVLVDYTIGMLLELPDEDTHILLAGMEFGRKSRILADLLKRKGPKNKEQLLHSLSTMRNSKRDLFVHSWIKSDEHSVTFLSRSKGGDYRATEEKFVNIRFRMHVKGFLEAAQKFQDALEISDERMFAFADAALSANKSSTTSLTESSANE
jgi:hypothetical protein